MDGAAALVAELRRQGITDELVLAAISDVDRAAFVPTDEHRHAWENHPVPIGSGQTISQPYIVALMTQELDVGPGDRVLEVGTGSGYQAAILAEIGARVHSIEVRPELAARARAQLADLGYSGVDLRVGSGQAGWPEHAPYDGIIVTASPRRISPTWIEQLRLPDQNRPGGRLVSPIDRPAGRQELLRVTRTRDGYEEHDLGGVRFVPLV